MYNYYCFPSGPSTQEFVQVSAAGISGGLTFPAGQTSVNVPFTITNDDIAHENLESYFANLILSTAAMAASHTVGSLSRTEVQVRDDDGTCSEHSTCMKQPVYSGSFSRANIFS